MADFISIIKPFLGIISNQALPIIGRNLNEIYFGEHSEKLRKLFFGFEYQEHFELLFMELILKMANNQSKEVKSECIKTETIVNDDGDETDQEISSFKFTIIIQDDEEYLSLKKHVNITVTGKINSVEKKAREMMRGFDDIKHFLCFGKNQTINELITSENKKRELMEFCYSEFLKVELEKLLEIYETTIKWTSEYGFNNYLGDFPKFITLWSNKNYRRENTYNDNRDIYILMGTIIIKFIIMNKDYWIDTVHLDRRKIYDSIEIEETGNSE